MLEKVWDKGEAYYKGYMLGVIIAEVESYREVVTILRAYKKKDRAAIVDEMQKMCKTEERRDFFKFMEKYRHLSVEYAAKHVLEESEFFIADRRKE